MLKVGFLGGGQLGRMLMQAAANYPVLTYILENDENAPAAHLCHHFQKGSVQSFDDVYSFGKKVDVLSIELENVNVDALEKLENEGLKVIPSVSAIKTIKNKQLQKKFYQANEIPTAPFQLVAPTDNAKQLVHNYPCIFKLAEGGYDGRGVWKVEDEQEWDIIPKQAGIIEEFIKIEKEIAVIIAVGQDKKIAIFPPVEMVFNHQLNQLDYQICPAQISEKVLWKVEAIAHKIAQNFNSAGLFAVEFLVAPNEDVFVNEVAPRVHNSGHHSIEAINYSQFDAMLRIVCGYPLIEPEVLSPSAMVNLIGEENENGIAHYQGLNEVLEMNKTYVHIYQKQNTKPGRKMGHVTVLGNNISELNFLAKQIKSKIKVVAHK